MKLTHFARIGVPIACCVTLAFAAQAPAKTVPSHLRVLTSSGKVLADHVQYTGKTAFRASKKADCFGSPSSAKRYRLGSANALGLLVDAERLARALEPVLITDAFFEDFGSMGVCGIGGRRAPFVPFDPENPQPTPYWYIAHDHTGATTGPDQLSLSAGDDVLYYLTKGTEAGSPDQLSLDAPKVVKNAKPFKVTVYVYDAGTGKRTPAEGAKVRGETTNAAGKATIAPNGEGNLVLRATRGDDVPSAKAKVCVGDDCGSPRGELILGSPRRDQIEGTKLADRIKPGGGRDVVEAGAGDDTVVATGKGRDVIDCGPGDGDVARISGRDRARNCEKVVRA
jgi:hypothetical protein